MRPSLFICLCLLSSCSTIKVTYDFDRASDFSKYKTYEFTEEANKLPIQELDRSRILSAVEKEMSSRGFTKSNNPDVLIDLLVTLEKKQEATANSTGTGMYGMGGPYRYGYGGGFTTTQISVYNYVEGTLFINMIDKKVEKLVWQGRGTKTLDDDASVTKKEQNITYAVAQIFKNYPPKKAAK